MARDVNDVVVLGFGPWSDVNGLPTLGYGIGAASSVGDDRVRFANVRNVVLAAQVRRVVGLEDER